MSKYGMSNANYDTFDQAGDALDAAGLHGMASDMREAASHADNTIARLAEALDQAVTSMQDSGYRSTSAVISECRAALAFVTREQEGKCDE